MINGADEKAPKRMKLLVSDTQENRHAQIRIHLFPLRPRPFVPDFGLRLLKFGDGKA
jgi:hypothetical protein